MADIIDITSACVTEFFAFLKANPNIAGLYRAAVFSLVATLDQQIAAGTAVIAQLTILVNIQDVALQTYNSIVQQLTSQLSNLPFNQFKTCPGISDLVKFINTNIDPYNINVDIPLIGNIKVNLKDELYDQSRRKSYLEDLSRVNKDREALREFLTKSLTLI